MKRNFIKKIDCIKNYLSLIIIIPAVLGGFWQLIELSTISTSYIRFFSISQVVPDGLLVLFIIFCIVGSLYISKLLRKWFKFSDYLEMFDWKFMLAIMIFLLNVIFILGILIYSETTKIGFIPFSYIILIIILVTFYIGAIIELLTYNFKKQFFDHQGNKIKKETKPDPPKWKSNLVGLLLMAGIFGTFYVLTLIFGIITDLRKSFIETDNIVNIEVLKQNIQVENTGKKFNEIIYFNDKYFFVELKDSLNKSYIRVFKTEKIF